MATSLRNVSTQPEELGRTVDRLRELKVLIAHDWLVAWAGSERCVDEMLRIVPSADVLIGVIGHSMRNNNDLARRARETWLAKVPGARRHHRWFLPLEGLAFASVDTSAYDLVISSSHAFAKMIRTGPSTLHVCYCYSPPRYLWDLNATYRSEAKRVQQLALAAATRALRWIDRRSAAGVDHFIGISAYIAERIRRVYGRDADVVHPPVQVKPGARVDQPRERFLLSLGRLVSYKRIDLAIHAAERLGIRLVIAGDGPERSRLERLAGVNTTFLGQVTEVEAARLLSSCAAFVFCAEDDFGIAPVEANAHGTPVVGLARGGLTETMVAGTTAEFFEEQSVDAVADAIERALGRRWERGELRRNAERFSAERFRNGLVASIDRAFSRLS